MICPECHGGRIVTGLACPGARIIEHKCFTCGGAGEITYLHARLIRDGKRLRQVRLEKRPYISQFDAAKRLGVDRIAYAHLEQGIPDAWTAIGLTLDQIENRLRDGKTK